MRLGVSLVVGGLFSMMLTGSGLTDEARPRVKHEHRSAHKVRHVERYEPPAFFARGRLVSHPAFNIACQTRDRALRALPCDQPVWVYGSPCEIDLGLGRWRNCD